MTLPKIIVHSTASVDGCLTLAPDVLLLRGDPRWDAVAGADAETYTAIMRAYQPQAVLEGSGSFLLDTETPDPLPPFSGDAQALYQDYLPEEIVNAPGRKWFTTVDTRGRVRWLYKEFPAEEWAGFYTLVIVSRATPPAYLAYLRAEQIPYLVAGHQRADLRLAFEKMRALLGVETLVSTAGGRLNGALLRAGLIDEIDLILFPALIGGTNTPSLFTAPNLLPAELPLRLELIEAQPLPGGSLHLRYRPRQA